MKVKICGLTSLEAAQTAENAGADFLGFIFADSKRKISPEKAKEIIEKLNGKALKVGVFVNESLEEMERIQHFTGIDIIQLHGQESVEKAGSFSIPVIKAFSIRNEVDFKKIDDYPVDYQLLDLPKDSGSSNEETLDWQMIHRLRQSRNRLILAGGLTPMNVFEAIKLVQPFAVDVSSGVETNGYKDHEKIRLFIKNAKL
ncbi:phosphoribosylanthranilate isomerase [Peribacillus sp. FSL H8-0477]|uniref:phosphoribosylanthranilate isomerase n=1 Tax=Peribacillus sp. FSL H8-0477 TaxID=2921388 RepID=UPI0030F89FB9